MITYIWSIFPIESMRQSCSCIRSWQPSLIMLLNIRISSAVTHVRLLHSSSLWTSLSLQISSQYTFSLLCPAPSGEAANESNRLLEGLCKSSLYPRLCFRLSVKMFLKWIRSIPVLLRRQIIPWWWLRFHDKFHYHFGQQIHDLIYVSFYRHFLLSYWWYSCKYRSWIQMEVLLS